MEGHDEHSVAASNDARPPLYQDRSFHGIVLTQFLGAFNDNVFRQLVLLSCIKLAASPDENLQGHAQTVFAIPFVLLSGYCGYLSDIYSKRTVVVLSKVLEIVVMVGGLFAFLAGSVHAMLAILFFMGAQSALFGPSKYGILPELFRRSDLIRVNGMVQMTTFLAIIFGLSLAGQLMVLFEDRVWVASLACVLIAVAGTITSVMIRPTPVAQPGMKFEPSMLAVGHDTRRLLRSNRKLLMVLTATSLFWMTGGTVYSPAINDLGLKQFSLDEGRTSLLAAATGLGIAVGCLLGGLLSKSVFSGQLVRGALWGMAGSLVALSLPGPFQGTLLGVTGSALALICLGLSAGLFTVPLLAYIQSHTPEQQRGRIIGAMNLANWIGIAAAGQYYAVANIILRSLNLPYQTMFAVAALLLVPLLILFHPETEPLTVTESGA